MMYTYVYIPLYVIENSAACLIRAHRQPPRSHLPLLLATPRTMTATPSLWGDKALSVVCIPFTAFTPDGETVLVNQVEAQAEYCVAQGNDVALLQGTTGEWPSLSLQERIDLATEWRRCIPVGHKMKLILHIGHDALVDAMSLARLAAVRPSSHPSQACLPASPPRSKAPRQHAPRANRQRLDALGVSQELEYDAVLLSPPSKFVAPSLEAQVSCARPRYPTPTPRQRSPALSCARGSTRWIAWPRCSSTAPTPPRSITTTRSSTGMTSTWWSSSKWRRSPARPSAAASSPGMQHL
jgi:hypothetical protein